MGITRQNILNWLLNFYQANVSVPTMKSIYLLTWESGHLPFHLSYKEQVEQAKYTKSFFSFIRGWEYYWFI